MVRVPGTWHFYAAQPGTPLPKPANYTRADEHMLQEPAKVEKASEENSARAAEAEIGDMMITAAENPRDGKEGAR